MLPSLRAGKEEKKKKPGRRTGNSPPALGPSPPGEKGHGAPPELLVAPCFDNDEPFQETGRLAN